MRLSRESLPEGTYVELVRSLFATLLTTVIMSLAYVGVGLLVEARVHDHPLSILIWLGVLASAGRIGVLLVYRSHVADETMDAARARSAERRYAWAYFSFAIVLGLSGARGFAVAPDELLTPIVGLLFGYGAGVAAVLSLRPWISVPSILVAITPTMLIALCSGRVPLVATDALMAVFLAGGIQSMLARYRAEVRKVTMRRLMATLARRDELTGLPNRLSLREGYEAASRACANRLIAVHCLDLDGFKPVNDSYGHPVGDLLLKAVSGRLGNLLRQGDVAARIGGDEFVIVQACISHPGEADMLARRIVRAVAEPFGIDGRTVKVATSVGYAMAPQHGTDLDRLMSLADEALYRVKRAGGGAAAYKVGTTAEDVPAVA